MIVFKKTIIVALVLISLFMTACVKIEAPSCSADNDSDLCSKASGAGSKYVDFVDDTADGVKERFKGWTCGDGFCELADGEDASLCPEDCKEDS